MIGLIFDLTCAAMLVVMALEVIFDLGMNVIKITTYLGIFAYIILVVMACPPNDKHGQKYDGGVR